MLTYKISAIYLFEKRAILTVLYSRHTIVFRIQNRYLWSVILKFPNILKNALYMYVYIYIYISLQYNYSSYIIYISYIYNIWTIVTCICIYIIYILYIYIKYIYILNLYIYIKYIYILYIYIYILNIYIYIYIKNKTFISKRVVFQLLPNLRRLNKIRKSVKSINLKTNKNRIKEEIKLRSKVMLNYSLYTIKKNTS